MGAPIGGFFDGADVVFATPASFAAAPRVLAETTTLPTKSVPIDQGTHTGKISEAIPIPAETLTPQEVATPPATVQTKVASPVTPFVISTSEPFAVLSQAVKDGSSLLATPSSNPSSATYGPDADLSFEGSKDILEDSDDEPVLKKMISESDDEESVPLEAEFMGMCLSPFLLFYFCQVNSSFFFFFFCHLFLTRMCLRLPFAAISLYLYVYFIFWRDF